MAEPIYCPRGARGLPCLPCEELSTVEEEIRLLNAKRILIRSRVDRAHNPTSRVPSEIMSKIFTEFVPVDTDESYGVCVGHHRFAPVGHVKGKITTTPILLSAVCTTWRDIAQSTPQLWTSVSVDLSSEIHFDLLRGWLARSGMLPLHILIDASTQELYDIEISEKIIGLFATYAPRWFSLTITITHSQYFLFSFLHVEDVDPLMLHALKIVGYDLPDGITLGRIPNLRKITMDDLTTRSIQHLNFRTLTNVEGIFSSVDAVFHIFSNIPGLTHCTFDIAPDNMDDAETFRTTFIHHDSLVYLNIQLWDSLTDTVLSWLKLPALQHLAVDSLASAVLTVNVADLINRSSCSIKTLQINISREVQEYPSRIIPLLQSIPSTEDLEIRCIVQPSPLSIDPLLIMLSTTTLIVKNSESNTNFLPRLKTFRIIYSEFSWGCLIDMIQAHLDSSAELITEDPESNGRPLRSLCFVTGGLKNEIIPEECSEKLALAKAAGFQITFES
ncbi:hypothetical protein BDN70DRAFT_990735 [Pholiota conissans]|uniref:F-box domain-containing protein n=1 Tax=Pholiota conissans TaxID=109636 RepID=A0A9P5ZA47_9AGAR|nr:hypothetical protein BDN70DRAFT_990735 [Pholiota conissans]